MRLDVAGRRRDPGTQYDCVDKGDAAKLNPSQEMGAKRDTASYIVSRDSRGFKPSKLDQPGEQTRLSSDRDVQAISPLRLTKPEKVKRIYPEAGGELRHDVPPGVRAARRPMHENHRRALAEGLVGYLAAGEFGTVP